MFSTMQDVPPPVKMTASQVKDIVNRMRMPATASQASTPADERNPITSATATTIASESRLETTDVSTWAHSTLERAIGIDWNRSKMPLSRSVKSRKAV